MRFLIDNALSPALAVLLLTVTARKQLTSGGNGVAKECLCMRTSLRAERLRALYQPFHRSD